MPAKNGFDLVNGDIDLLDYVFQLRLATIDHLSALSGRSVRALWGRLPKLRQHRYLSSPKRFMQKRVYGLGTLGVAALIDEGYASSELAARRLRHNELSEFGIRHSLFIADIHTRLLVFSRNGHIHLAHWQEGPSLWDTVPVGESGSHMPIRPDAHVVLADSGQSHKTIQVFLEADRSTMAHTRMAEKITAYLAYHGSRRHTRKYPGMQSFIVATVTQTRSRATELRRSLEPLIPRSARHAYLFVPFDDLSPASFQSRLFPHDARHLA